MATESKTQEWQPPSWMHKAKVSDTSFLSPKKLNHGKMLEKKKKENNERKAVPKHSILAEIQIQEFEELFDELFELEHSKLRLIHSTSKEIDKLRQRIIELSDQTMTNNPSKKSYFMSFLSFFSFGNKNDNFEPVIRARFSDPEAMEQRIKQIKRTKIELIQQTSKQMDELRQIIEYLEQINDINDKGKTVKKSIWNMLWLLLAAVAIGFTVPII
eukprot:122948_1